MLKILDLHDVGFQSLLQNFFQDCIAIIVVDDSHPHQTVVVESEQSSSSDVVLLE